VNDIQTEPPKSSLVRRGGAAAAVGAVIGFVAWSLAGPGIISLWYEPPSRDAFSCAGTVKTALSQFVKMQLISAVIGAAGVAVLWLAVRRGGGRGAR